MYAMRSFILLLLCLHTAFSYSQSAPEKTENPDGFFDPERDPVAVLFKGQPRLVVSEMTILRSVSANFERVGAIEKVDRRFWNEHWFITLESRHSQSLEESVFVMIRLKSNEKGEYFAEPWWMACTGNSCGSCDYAGEYDGCVCRFDKPGEPGVPGFCYHTISADPLMVRVPSRP